MQTIVPISSVSFALAAFLSAPPALYLPTNIISRNRRATLSLSAILLFSSIPYTYMIIIPRVERLKRIERAIVKGTLASHRWRMYDRWPTADTDSRGPDPEAGNGGVESELAA